MKGYSVYSKIKQLNEKGFKKATVAKQLGINRRTANRYWDTTVDDYETNAANICRNNLLDEFKDIILL
ncbi:MAG: hypothetical protein PHG58_05130 [Clostridia bacterium]|nr:hypothetical protein [Clostridia bacterium]